jgi:hypothetical protein
MLAGYRGHDDPGLPHLKLLQVSNGIDRPLPIRARPRCMRARLCLAEALTVALITLVVAGWIIATP